MRILIADDDDVSRLELASLLTHSGYEVTVATDGPTAWNILRGKDPPRLAILDWLMDEMDGVDVCRRVRECPELRNVYLILLTSRGDREHILEGLRAGANDYVTKPYEAVELLARVRIGTQLVALQSKLVAKVHDMEDTLTQVKQLQGLLPICCYCKSIRDGENTWQKVESYVRDHSEATFSHGICPECWNAHVKPQFDVGNLSITLCARGKSGSIIDYRELRR